LRVEYYSKKLIFKEGKMAIAAYLDSKGKGLSGEIDVPIKIHLGVNGIFEGIEIDGVELRKKTSKFLGMTTKISSTGEIYHHANLTKLGAIYSVLDEMDVHPFDTGQNPDWFTLAIFRAGDFGDSIIDVGLVLFSLDDLSLSRRLFEQAGLSESDLPAALFGLRTRLEGDHPTFDYISGKSSWMPAPSLTTKSTLWADVNFSLESVLKGEGLKDKKEDNTIGIFTNGENSQGLALLYIDGNHGMDVTQEVFAEEYERHDCVLNEEQDEGRIILARKQ